MTTCFILRPSWQSAEKASCQGYLFDGSKQSLTILEKFLTITLIKVKQQWPREIRRILIFWI